MQTRDDLNNSIKTARATLTEAEKALYEFNQLPENNVFETLEKGASKIEDTLRDMAHEDCEGAGNCGADEYRRKFMVGTDIYEGVLNVEYDRHDKTYYYIDRAKFTVTNTVTNEVVIDE
jgi:hypothetical protein